MEKEMSSPVEPKLLPTSSSRKSRMAEKGYLLTDKTMRFTYRTHWFSHDENHIKPKIGVLTVGKTNTSRAEHTYLDIKIHISGIGDSPVGKASTSIH